MIDFTHTGTLPRLPLDGSLDLTYRCDNRCRHCWLWQPDTAAVRERELSCDEIHDLVEEARALGCRSWSISGGEPMLRPDFAQVFEHITRRSARYSLNTNGTRITPEIARLMTRPGMKMVALYGATAATHDHITRTPGSYERTMEGFARLREAGAGFTVQIVPLRDNHHELAAMEELATRLSRHWRIGASWLFLSADGDPRRDAEIVAQRLDPADAVALDPPSPFSEASAATGRDEEVHPGGADRPLERCAAERGGFHIDPFGGLSACLYVKDPDLRYDLRSGSFRAGWEEFIPTLADRVRGGDDYASGCGACTLRDGCRWCDVYGYLEHRRHGARVDYLCELATVADAERERIERDHRRTFAIAGLTVRVESELPIGATTFDAKFATFAHEPVERPDVVIQHAFDVEGMRLDDLGPPVYRRVPWSIHRVGRSWVYVGIVGEPAGGYADEDGADVVDDDDEQGELVVADESPYQVVVCSEDHTRVRIHHDALARERWGKGGLHALTMMPTDQIVLSRVLADRGGCYVHSGGVVLDGQGLVFVGHSGAGKSTAMRQLEGRAEVLCDDRNILTYRDGQATVHGTWSHGEVPVVSSASAPLRALLFLRQTPENRLVPMDDRLATTGELASYMVKPLVTAEWWEKSLAVVDAIVAGVPCYEMRFDRSGGIVPLLEELARR